MVLRNPADSVVAPSSRASIAKLRRGSILRNSGNIERCVASEIDALEVLAFIHAGKLSLGKNFAFILWAMTMIPLGQQREKSQEEKCAMRQIFTLMSTVNR
jgi:hypothetical protein